LKRLNTLSRYNRCPGFIPIRRAPIDLRLSIGIPNREYHDVPLAIIDNRFWRLANTQGAGAQ
jgi:hypothetical protein